VTSLIEHGFEGVDDAGHAERAASSSHQRAEQAVVDLLASMVEGCSR
jgi:hypothetical protein